LIAPEVSGMRVAVVTGGASGIGRAICYELARQGNAVVVLDLDGQGAERVAKELEEEDVKAWAGQVDVSDRSQVDDTLAQVRSELGPVAILVTSAGLAPMFEPFSQISLELWNRIIAINLTGTFNCVQSAIPDMVEAGWGRVVMISSSSAQRGAPGMAQYAASKGGVIALTKSVALEYASYGITVNNIAPSSIDTPSVHRKQAAGKLPSSKEMGNRIPVGRIGTGKDIAIACNFLCSEEASYITGQTLSVNGGSFLG
jgi:2-hydroxycyclohexanecarboxyl-CoA dehydrogenase